MERGAGEGGGGGVIVVIAVAVGGEEGKDGSVLLQ